jgi:NAD(P)-dependent dehydrogenase (short-subunit alcohol dehydrogenase family)
MTNTFEGRVALVTGAGSGIGRASALLFAQRGARVVAADVNGDAAQETVQTIEAEGGASTATQTDVSSPAEVEAMVAQALQTYGRIDCAFNNAGIEGEMAPTAQCSEANWDRTIAVNLKGVWLCMRAEIPAMLEQGAGAIVNCASVAGLVGFAGLPAYCASKGGIVQLTKTAALEYAQHGIRVNALCPGVIHTPMVDRLTGEEAQAEAQFTALEPIGRMGTPQEMAQAAVWLCSDEASFVTGHPFAADGGFVAA